MTSQKCSFKEFCPKKKSFKFCHIEVAVPPDHAGDVLCSHHSPAISPQEAALLPAGVIKRTFCPFNNKHTVFSNALEKHKRKCPDRPSDPSAAPGEPPAKRAKKGVYVAAAPPQPEHASADVEVSLDSPETVDLLIRILSFVAKGGIPPIESSELVHESFPRLFPEVSHKKRKHVLQESSIIAHLERSGFLPTSSTPEEGSLGHRKTVFVEFGAGTGTLSRHISQACDERTTHVLVDRMDFRSRNKVDYQLKHRRAPDQPTATFQPQTATEPTGEGESSPPGFVRLVTDIRELSSHPDYSKIFLGTRAVCLGKHFCGCASDIALQFVCSELAKSCPEIGICLATCCHALCTWDEYVNKTFLERVVGVSNQREFVLLAKMSAWATLSIQESGADESKSQLFDERWKEGEAESLKTALEQSKADSAAAAGPSDLAPRVEIPREQKKKVGYAIKRLLDFGRISFLKDHGLNVNLVNFTSLSVENGLIISSK